MPSLSRFLFPSWIPVSGFWPLGSREVRRTNQHWLWHSVLSHCHSSPQMSPSLHSSPFYQTWIWTLETPCGLRWLHTSLQQTKRAGTPYADMACFLSPFCSPNEDAEVAGPSWRSDEERWKTLMHGLYPRKVRELSFAVTSYTNLTTPHSGGGGNLLHKTNPWDNTKRFCYAHSGNRISVPENY